MERLFWGKDSAKVTCIRLASLFGLSTFLISCYLPPPVYVLEKAPAPRNVPGPPPAPRLEIPPPIPDPGHVWLDGYWHWDGEDYQWIEGAWAAPQPGYTFINATYLEVGGQWTYQPPYWCPPSNAGIEPPPPVPDPDALSRHHVRPKTPAADFPSTARRRAPPSDDAPFSARRRAPPSEDAPSKARRRAPPSDDAPFSAHQRTSPAHDLPRGVDAASPAGSEPRLGRHGSNSVTNASRWGVARPNGVIVLNDLPEAKEIHEDPPDPSASQKDALQRLPTYRGRVEGRPSFGDDPTSEKRRRTYRTDATGAIILSSPRRNQRVVRHGGGSLEVIPPRGKTTEDAAQGTARSARRQHREWPMVVPPPQRPMPARSTAMSGQRHYQSRPAIAPPPPRQVTSLPPPRSMSPAPRPLSAPPPPPRIVAPPPPRVTAHPPRMITPPPRVSAPPSPPRMIRPPSRVIAPPPSQVSTPPPQSDRRRRRSR